MGWKVDARDVLDVNARTTRGFHGVIVGHFHRVGPDVWDDYEYVQAPGGAIEVYPGLEVQLEPSGCLFRMRSVGRVLMVAWDPQAQGGGPPEHADASRERFVADFLEVFDEKPGYGAAAVIAKKLS